jgi:hypothetical protein
MLGALPRMLMSTKSPCVYEEREETKTNLLIISSLQISLLPLKLPDLRPQFFSDFDPSCHLLFHPCLIRIQIIQARFRGIESKHEIVILSCQTGNRLVLVLNLDKQLMRQSVKDNLSETLAHLFLSFGLMLQGNSQRLTRFEICSHARCRFHRRVP